MHVHSHRVKAARKPAMLALAAALLFGASTPAAKVLLGEVQPQLLAGLMYLGSGLGLSIGSLAYGVVRRQQQSWSFKASDLPWLAGAVIAGGIFAPILLMIGLSTTQAGSASLLLNLEAVFTALLAWFAFKENFDLRIFSGLVAIVLGSAILSCQPGIHTVISLGAWAIVGACFCWAMDNNLTRNIADADATQIAAVKGLVAGTVNVSIGLALGAHLPSFLTTACAGAIGFLGYGISLILYIMALRGLGSARTGAYFATAPFAGALLSILFLHEPASFNLLLAGGLMAFGTWLHLTEVHEHNHSHLEEEHEHMHTHDEHHQHAHGADISEGEPHSHWHKHGAITHSHRHYPDVHHRHEH